MGPKLQRYIIELHSRAFLPFALNPETPEFAAIFHSEDELAKRQAQGAAENNAETHSAYIQFLDHPSLEQRAQLKIAGLDLISYTTGFAWVAQGNTDAFKAAAALPFVRGFARIDPRDKMLYQVFLQDTPAYAQTGDGLARLTVLTVPGMNAEALKAQLATQAALNAQTAASVRPIEACPLGPRFEAVADIRQVFALASAPGVMFIEFAPPPMEPRDATTDSSSNVGVVRDQGPKLDGTGIKVAVREIGKPDAHVDFAARMQLIDLDGDAVNKDHATAVVGQIASSGVAQPAAKGIAPNVNVLVYSLTNDAFTTRDIIDAGGRGARLSNHSYGPGGLTTFGEYQTVSATWDDALRNNNLVAFFAGNEESDQLSPFKHIDFFVGMKNGLCIEASSATAKAGNPDGSPPVPATNGSAFFAKYGPMNDGRVKPDLVAFGDNVVLDQGTNNITTNSGTSFSTPAATGMAALIFQEYKTKLGAEPSAALTKALLCESASDLGTPGPDAIYGFGIVNVQEAIKLIDSRTSPQNSPFSEGSETNGQVQTYTLNVGPGLPFLKTTLCWMDPAGNPSAAKALVNDLDMTLTDPNGAVYFPYSLNAASPMSAATNTGPNRVDPVEQIIVPTPMAGVWTATVSGFSIPSGSQSYAFCSNLVLGSALSAIAEASPVSGPAPLSVTFSAAASTGNIVRYHWEFGDGTSDDGVELTHTYVLPQPPLDTGSATFKVTLIVFDTLGATQSDAHIVITVTKPLVNVFPNQASGRVSFVRPSSDQLQFTLIVPELVLTPQQTRDAIRNGTFEGKKFTVRAGPPGQPLTGLSQFLVNRHASQIGQTESLKINLQKGAVTVAFKNTPAHDLSAFFQRLGITPATPAGTLPSGLHVQIETNDVIYDATFPNLRYTARKGGGTLASP
jgi:PKD repeat protein